MGSIGHSGWKLVDVVNSIWNLGSNAITLVKNAATSALNAVKSGLEYIANAVLGPIIDQFVIGFQLILKTIGYILGQMINSPELTITILTDGIQINEYTIRIYRDFLSVVLDINGVRIKLDGMFIYPTVSFDNLGVGLEKAESLQEMNEISFVLFMIAKMAVAVAQEGETETWTETSNDGMQFHGSDSVMIKGGTSFYQSSPPVLAAKSAGLFVLPFVMIAIPTIISYLSYAVQALFSWNKDEGTNFFASMIFFHAFSAIAFGASSKFASNAEKYVELGRNAFRLPGESPTGSASMAILGLIVDTFTFASTTILANFIGFGSPSLLSYIIGGIFALTSLIVTAKGYVRIGKAVQEGLTMLTFINIILMIVNIVLLGVRQIMA